MECGSVVEYRMFAQWQNHLTMYFLEYIWVIKQYVTVYVKMWSICAAKVFLITELWEGRDPVPSISRH
jgi:hypothetical protein